MKVILICYLLLNCPTAVGHPYSDSRKESGPARCQDNEAMLGSINQKAAPDQLIIVIARLGDGEVRQGLNWRRLHNVRAFWTEFIQGEYRRNPGTVILAEGERVSGHGRLEF